MNNKKDNNKLSQVIADYTEAKNAPERPHWHFAPPSHFMFDCWGAVVKDGWYHIFVDVCLERGTPNGKTVFWHAHSQDLLHWEHLPSPMLPDETEIRTNDGFIGFDGNGHPILLYTSVPYPPNNNRCHRAAVGTDDLLNFERFPGAPFLTLDNHGGPPFYGGWSDPYLFEADGKIFLLISKCTQPGVGNRLPVYEAEDDTLLRWKYRGILLEHNGEVVNFFPLDGKWVLIDSPYQAIEAFVGTLDTENMRFVPERHEILSFGYHKQDAPLDRGLYATSIYRLAERTILCGWISGPGISEYWDGCMCVPRELSLTEDLMIIQKPIIELNTLREPISDKEFVIEGKSNAKPYQKTASFTDSADIELTCRFDGADGAFALALGSLSIRITPETVSLQNDIYPLNFASGIGSELHIRLLLDRTLCEIFLGENEAYCGRISATCRYPYPGSAPQLYVCVSRGTFALRAWHIKDTPTTFSPLFD